MHLPPVAFAIALACFAACGDSEEAARPAEELPAEAPQAASPVDGDQAAAAPAVPGQAPRHVRVVWTERPQHEALVAWDTGAERGTNHGLWMALGGSEGQPLPMRVEAELVDEYDGKGHVAFHHVPLRQLPADEKVRFVVDSDGRRSREYHFYTAPSDDKDFAILSGGDSRSHRASRQDMNRMLAELVAGDPALLALAHGGDYIYSGWQLDEWQEWLEDLELAVPESGRLLPFIPARGNHEAGGPMYDQVFGAPGGGLGQNYFTTVLSAEVVLVTLNTERAAGGDQLEFLEETLRQHRDRRYRLVQYHRPIFPAVKNPYLGKWTWQPVFERGGVAVALESDGHVLKRTPPILGEEVADGGVVYLGEGGLGVKQRTPKADRWYLQPPGIAIADHHVWRLEFVDGTCEALALGIEGDELDRAELPPRAPAEDW